MQERKFERADLSARAIAINDLQLHLRFKIYVSEIQSFLLVKQMSNVSLRTKQSYEGKK